MTRHITIALAGLIAVTGVASQAEETVATQPPSVIKTVPVSGDTKVSIATTQIKVTFSKKMMDKSWSFAQNSTDTFPEIVGQPKFSADQRTCTLTVKLKPRKTYIIWLNSQKFQNFKDASGRPAVPYLLTFQTK